jgi:hypothetical protein
VAPALAVAHAPWPAAGTRATAPQAAAPPDDLVGLLDAIGWEPVTLEQVLLRAPLDLASMHAGLTRLEELGWITWEGNWVERRSPGGLR